MIPLRKSLFGKKKRWWIFLGAVVCLVCWVNYKFADGERHCYHPLKPSLNELPSTRTIPWQDRSELSQEILTYWAGKPLGDWKTKGKIDIPRILMARFLLRRELDESNDYLLEHVPWGRAGSTWWLHREGDYDFTMAGLIPILFLFGDDPEVLYPAARDHLVNSLLPLDGGEPQVKVPRTFGVVNETENHLLMTEGARYLKNRWLWLRGSDQIEHDNLSNGLEDWLLKLIAELRAAGPYEFNSIPYEGYTLIALLNLEAFGSDRLAEAARALLDQLNWNYAVGSFNYRRFVPFRRQYAHSDDTALDGDRHVALIKTWMSLHPDVATDPSLSRGQHIALWACWSSYRLPDETANWILRRESNYFVRIGHGRKASPEIFSGGADYLLTAGGVNRGRRSMIVARPITLMLDDDADDLSDLLHLSGPGDDFRQWNNTGVWKQFAVAAGPVHIPKTWVTRASGTIWKVYQQGALCIAVYSSSNLGVVHVVNSSDPEGLLSAVESANADVSILLNAFQFPNGTRIEYDTTALKTLWVIKRVGDQSVDREFDDWPLLEMR